jgi:hypothetical protein
MLRQGWQTFGDIGHVDADGYLYLTDRQDDMERSSRSGTNCAALALAEFTIARGTFGRRSSSCRFVVPGWKQPRHDE